jgi:hypothetical protein
MNEKLQAAAAERSAFAKAESPTQLQRHLASRGVVVTVHAARKWIVGEAIPTQDKLRALASFLGVDPAWLRYGIGDGADVGTKPVNEIAPRTMRVINGFNRLTNRDQTIVESMVRQLLRMPEAA